MTDDGPVRSTFGDLPVQLDDVRAAARRLQGRVLVTPTVAAPVLSERSGSSVSLKLESLQPSGSFKVRGAWNAVIGLDGPARERGVVTLSTGNHGRALAHVARAIGVRCVVCLSRMVPAARVEAIRALGAEVAVVGESQDEAAAHAHRLAEAGGMTLIHPFDDPAVIAGQGTVGLELARQVEGLDVVIVPVSGGGLVSGIAVALKGLRSDIEIVGVSSASCPAMAASLAAGRPTEVPEAPSLADNLGGGIGLDNRFTFQIVRRLVDRIVLVDDDEVRSAMRSLYTEARLVVEGAGAASSAALLQAAGSMAGRRVAVIVSGGNADPSSWAAAVAD